jgi:hypothetical protein
LCNSSQGPTQPLSVLISSTVARAVSGLAQKPASAWEASKACSRSALAVRSKKASEFGDAMLQLGQALDEIGHGLPLQREGPTKGVNAASRSSAERGGGTARVPQI